MIKTPWNKLEISGNQWRSTTDPHIYGALAISDETWHIDGDIRNYAIKGSRKNHYLCGKK